MSQRNSTVKSQFFAVHRASIPGLIGGQHGYDNLYPSMQSIFLGQGPSLKSPMTITPFSNVEVYNLMCDLIDVRPAPNNGTYGKLHHVLRLPPKNISSTDGSGSYIQPTRPSFPGSLQELHDRQNSACAVSCGIADIDAADLRLNISEADAQNVIGRVAPYGLPLGADDRLTIEALVGQDFALGFDRAMNATLWATFSLDSLVS